MGKKLDKRPMRLSMSKNAAAVKVRVCDVCYESNAPKITPKKAIAAPPSASILGAIKAMNNGQPPVSNGDKSAFGFMAKKVPKKQHNKQNSGGSLNDFIKKQEDELLQKFEQRA